VNKADLARADSTVPVSTVLVRVNYAKATSLVPAVKSILSSAATWSPTHEQRARDHGDDDARQSGRAVRGEGSNIRTPQVSIQGRSFFITARTWKSSASSNDLGSPTQFFNQLVARPDPRTAKPVDTNLDGGADALVRRRTSSHGRDVDLGGNSLLGLGNANRRSLNPALQADLLDRDRQLHVACSHRCRRGRARGYPGEPTSDQPNAGQRRRILVATASDPRRRRERAQTGGAAARAR